MPAALLIALSSIAGEHAKYFLFVPVLGVAAVSALAGVGPGLVASFVSIVCCAYVFLDPARSLAVDPSFEALRLGGVGAVSVLVAWTVGSLRSAYRRADRQRAAAQRAVRLREDVLAVVSHDLKAPLAAIALSLDLLERLAVHVPSISRHTARIRSSTEQMDRLIRDLLDAASIDAGKLSMERKREDAPSIAREALDRIQAVADGAGVRVALGRVEEPLPEVRCDRQRILQALGNLLQNAVKATARGGHVEIDLTRRGAGVALTVRDTGRGIAPEDLPYVFDRFRRGRSAAYAGSGLGLAIAKGIVEMHGGEIRVESRPGEGASFSVLLPGHGRTAADS